MAKLSWPTLGALCSLGLVFGLACYRLSEDGRHDALLALAGMGALAAWFSCETHGDDVLSGSNGPTW